ncbi:putative histone acetyltransferase chromatin regulator PHD family [Lupinus albus]|uniref:Putative histone acetyltransferase chromatin regulator PHD family n=1 Tax=Lupinus albus TaxID=3870 RepID=A0A6A4PXP0_LUPAL|nr:putative histone acetyltransferase chromatin regulator PHD family [Lupinus albus]
MEVGMRSGGPSGVLVKKKNASGCLIVRKKGNDGVDGAATTAVAIGSSSTSRKFHERPRSMPFNDSGSSGELLMPHSNKRVGPDTVRVCNSLTPFEPGVAPGREFGRKRGNGDALIAENVLDKRERKRSKLDVCNFSEYDTMDAGKMRRRHVDDNRVGFGGGRFTEPVHVTREFGTGSSRDFLDKIRNSYYDRPSDLYLGDSVDHNRLNINRDGAPLPPPLSKEKFNSREFIRIQGKNGVLKVMVNKRKMGGPSEHYDHHKPVESTQRLRTEGFANENVLNHPSTYIETKLAQEPGLNARPERKQIASRKSLSSKDSKGDEWDSDDGDTSLNPVLKNAEVYKPEKKMISENEKTITGDCKSKKIISEDEQTPMHEKLQTSGIKEGQIKRGSGTEKQKLRERIREMLLNAGWTIDYRPRRNRDYLDAVYINQAGTAYWSIIKAYEAFQKQLNVNVDEAKPKGDSSSFAPIADDVLSQLTRKTRKKMEIELKKNNKKKRHDNEIDSRNEPRIKRCSSNKHDMNGMDGDSNEDKLSSFMKQGNKQLKNKVIANTTANASCKSQNTTDHSNVGKEKSYLGCDPHLIHGRKSGKYGRCTLLLRNSNKGLNSESDDFVPHTGKQTVLSWLIDCGTVVLSQKVQYRRRKKVVLEGWITRDGIHCGCCSKILTVSKFELHAGSKLSHPYQNIYLESGVSLLQCQIDAWNKQETSEKIGFHSVDMNGDDAHDDTCGICGDGGDLICCDRCPSTFHQSCLDIQILPPGEWHCPNCTCKFCGVASGTSKNDDATLYALRTCNSCDKKYHDSCTKELDVLPNYSNTSDPSFCGKECKELFEHLKKYTGCKHELEAGFSWSLIHRTDEDSEADNRGIAHRVECNSKLAIALTVMDECFFPVVDRRSGINMIRNVLYNSGSNISRLSYCGFYTAILERGDEILSVASLRFHGTKLAEMPFIGTRYIYRRQGMCHRLFSAIESALCSLKVENLVIPAIGELMHTWTTNFGFTHLNESLKHEMRSLKMLVFPGIDMLQKLLVEQGKNEGNTVAGGSSALQDLNGNVDASSGSANKINDEFSGASEEANDQGSVDKTSCSKSHSEERLSDDSVSDRCATPSTSHGALDMKTGIAMAPPVDDELNPSPKCQRVSPKDNSVNSHLLDVSDCNENPTSVLEAVCPDPCSAEKLNRKCHPFAAMNHDSPKLDINLVLDSQVADNTLTSNEVYLNDVHKALEAAPSGNLSDESITK